MLYFLYMARSRLERVRNKKAGKQGLIYLVVAVALVIGTLGWGLPAIARLTGLMIKSDGLIPQNDELRPTPPIFSDIPEATHSGVVKIAGFAQPGLDVILFVNGAERERKLVSESGTYSFDKIALSEGENTIYGYTTTQHDLQSEQSKSYKIIVDLTKPKVTIDKPVSGEVFRGQSQRITNITGLVDESGAKVFIGERMAIVQADGTFSLPYQLIEGDQEIVIKGVDRAGNESAFSITLRWEP